jgi:hypothetical protein
MMNSDAPNGSESAPLDPKEAMKAALERKKTAQHARSQGTEGGGSKAKGGAHGQQGGKRVFRRKSGG